MNERLKQLRKQLGLTQEEFASRIHVKRNTVATYEMGRSTPSDSGISLICREYNVNERWLRDGVGDMFIELDRDSQLMEWAGSVLGGNDDAFKYRFVKMLSTLSDNEWSILEKMAIELSESKKD